ncbi:hypothetical protein DYB34_005203 [Aphanomyces astaci]|uniref:Uncharacterized protein n=4 Tax=Aphanomyces astaci TaxID=112090 RepID=A0A3R7DMI3_APHAT|nr:hypothetical protein DYB34_005203 [Aphanomyces astaci]
MFLRAVRRVLFQSRVVFALEKCAFKATSASITLSKQLDKLTEMHPISPPQGTFTPDSVAWAYNLVGVLSASQVKWEEALRNFTMAIPLHEFREALKVDPTHAATMTNTALALRQLGQLEEACRHLYTAATQADDKPSTDQHRQLVYYALANVIRELNRNDEAIEWYTKAAAVMDTSSQDTTQTRMDHVKLAVYHNRGSTMHTQLKFKRATVICHSHEPSRAVHFHVQVLPSDPGFACCHVIEPFSETPPLSKIFHMVGVGDSATGHRLLRFCERWASALKVACHDFLYAFHAFPCFHDIDIASTTPFLDLHMFRFQQLSHPNHPSLEVALEAMLNASESPDFPDMMWDALVHTQRGNFADAQRALLIAKYSTGTSVAEEQACLVVMDEYRGGMTCDVAKHVGRLCVLQGQLATHVEALRDAVQPTASKVTGELPSPRPLARTATRRSLRLRSASRRSFKPEDVKTLNLEDFNAAIAKCTAEMIQRPEAAVDEDAMADYVAQYDRVCAYIDASSASTAPASSLTREFSRAMLSRQPSFSKGLSRSGSNANSGGGSTAMLAQRTLGSVLSRHGESTSRILVASHNAPSGSSDAVPNDSAASSQSKDLTTSSSLRSRASL